MKVGDRVTFNGRTGTVKALQPAGMVDVCFDDSRHRIERRAGDRLAVEAKPNSSFRRPPRPARRPRGWRRNPAENESPEAQALRERYTQLVEGYRSGAVSAQEALPDVLDWLFNESLYKLTPTGYDPSFPEARLFMKAWAEGETDADSLRKYSSQLAAKRRDSFDKWIADSRDDRAARADDDRAARAEGYEDWVEKVVDEAINGYSWSANKAGGQLTRAMSVSLDPLARSEYVISQSKKAAQKEVTTSTYVPSDEEIEEARFVEQMDQRIKASAKSDMIERELGRVSRQTIKSKQTLTDVGEIVNMDGAGYFTRPDPSRVSSDGTALCGNPIDGTAYYLVIDDSPDSRPAFLKHLTVEQYFNLESPRAREKTGEARQFSSTLVLPPKKATSLKFLLGTEVLPKLVPLVRDTTERAIPGEREVATQLQRSSNLAEAQLKRRGYQSKISELEGLLASADRAQRDYAAKLEPTPPRLRDQINDYRKKLSTMRRRIADLDSEVLRLQAPEQATLTSRDRHYLRKAMVYVEDEPIGSLLSLLDADNDLPLTAKQQVKVVLPSLERTMEIERYFVEQYLPEQDERFDISISRQPVRGLRSIRGRERKGLSEELARKERSAKPPGQVPHESDDFYYWNPEEGQEYYFIVYSQTSLERQKLARFQAYRLRKFRYESTNADALAYAVYEASKNTRELAPLGVHPEVAAMFSISGGVSVNGAFETNPQVAVPPDSTIVMYLREKANNPFYSWVRESSPVLRSESRLPQLPNLGLLLKATSTTGLDEYLRKLPGAERNQKAALEARLRWAAKEANPKSRNKMTVRGTEVSKEIVEAGFLIENADALRATLRPSTDWPDCLSAAEREVEDKLRRVKNALWAYKKALRDIQYLFSKLRGDGSLLRADTEKKVSLSRWDRKAINDVDMRISGLASAYAFLLKTITRIRNGANGGNQADVRVYDMLVDLAGLPPLDFDPNYQPSVLQQALEMYRSGADATLILGEEMDVRPLDKEEVEPFKISLEKSILSEKPIPFGALVPSAGASSPDNPVLPRAAPSDGQIGDGLTVPEGAGRRGRTLTDLNQGSVTIAVDDLPKPGRSAYRWLREGGYRARLERLMRQRYGDGYQDPSSDKVYDWTVRTIVKQLDPLSRKSKKEPFPEKVARVKIKAKEVSKLPAEGNPDAAIAKMIFSDEVSIEALKNRFYFDRNVHDDVKLTHPMDDMVLYAIPSLSDESERALLQLRQVAMETDYDIGLNGSLRMRMIPGMREARPTRSAKWTSDPNAQTRSTKDEMLDADQSRPLKASVNYRDIARVLAAGGIRGKDGRTYDPVAMEMTETARPFSLSTPEVPGSSGRRVGDLLAQQDANWAIGLAVGTVFPDLVFKKGLTADQAADMAADLLLLGRMYDDLGGFRLSGPLNPDSPSVKEKIIDTLINGVSAAMVRLRGGATGLTATRTDERGVGRQVDIAVFKTYNPVLFELTRLFWPTARSTPDPGWSSILAHPELVQMVDSVGRFGYTAQLIQEKALGIGEYQQAPVRSPNELAQRLDAVLQPVYAYPMPGGETTPVSLDQLMLNRLPLPKIKGVRYSRDDFRAPPGLYAPFLLTWPLGASSAQVGELADQWITTPNDFLRSQKGAVSEGMKKVMSLRTRGVPKRPLRQLDPAGAGLVLNQIAESVLVLDPESPGGSPAEWKAREILAQELSQALPREGTRSAKARAERDFFSKTGPARDKAEKEALRLFQKRPGHVLEQQQGATKLTALTPVTATGVYDADTLELLEMRRQAGHAVTGNIQPVYVRKRADGTMDKPIYSGDPKQRLRGSAVAEAQHAKSVEYQEDLRSIDQRIKVLNSMIERANKARAKKAQKPSAVPPTSMPPVAAPPVMPVPTPEAAIALAPQQLAIPLIDTKLMRFQSRIYPEDLESNPDTLFVFGDNMKGTGNKGQAVIRGMPNAVGIPTKHLPATTTGAYFTDADLPSVKAKIDQAFAKLRQHIMKGKRVVYPTDGVGTGLAQLRTRAPAIFEYIEGQLQSLHALASSM